MKFHNPKFWIGLGLAIVVIVVIAVTGAINGDGSSESSGWTAGDRVVLAPDTGGWMPAAQIRSDLEMKLRIESGDKTGEALWTWGEWAASPGSC